MGDALLLKMKKVKMKSEFDIVFNRFIFWGAIRFFDYRFPDSHRPAHFRPPFPAGPPGRAAVPVILKVPRRDPLQTTGEFPFNGTAAGLHRNSAVRIIGKRFL